jgi:uncharacterized membrane protein
MSRWRTVLEQVRHSFWVVPAAGIALGAVLGLLAPGVDGHLRLPDAVSFSGDTETARAVLGAIVALTVSVAGISFSVIVVALVLSSQQLSPRVLRSFQRNPLNRIVLALFLGTAIYAVVVLSAVNGDESDRVPEFATSVAMVLAAFSLAFFVVFLHHILRSLNASVVIRRIASEGQAATEAPYPQGAGHDATDLESAERTLRELQRGGIRNEIAARRAGYLATVQAGRLVEIAAGADAFVQQRATIGEFVLTGAPLATVWTRDEPDDAFVERVRAAFLLNEERIVDHDIAFPIRQLADVALKGLSPSVNDPTTAENAMDSVADSLLRASNQDWGTELRLDAEQAPRLAVSRPSFDELVALGFGEVRRDAAQRPAFSVRLLELLAQLAELGGEPAQRSEEVQRQAMLVRDHAAAVAETDADRRLVEDAYDRLHEQSENSITLGR